MIYRARDRQANYYITKTVMNWSRHF